MNTNMRHTKKVSVMAFVALLLMLWPTMAMAQHTTTRRNVDTGSSKETTAKKNDATPDKNSSTAKSKSSTAEKKKQQKTTTVRQEEVDDTPANYKGGFHFGAPVAVSGSAVGSSSSSANTPAYIFVNRPMAIANGLNGADYKVVLKFLKTYYGSWERKEKKNESIMLSAAGGYGMSYGGVTPTYVNAYFVKKKFYSYSYYFMFDEVDNGAQRVKAFARRFMDDLAKEGIVLREVSPSGNELYRAEGQTDRKITLYYERVGVYYGMLLGVEF